MVVLLEASNNGYSSGGCYARPKPFSRWPSRRDGFGSSVLCSGETVRPCAQSTGEAFPLRLADIRQHDVFLFWPSRDEGIKRATKRQAQLTWEAMV